MKFESGYSKAVTGVFHVVNPIKKRVIKTNCTAHKFIMMQAMEILKNDGYKTEVEFFRQYIGTLNEGVYWADQDFKSSNHFFHVVKHKGLYGRSDLLTEIRKYYSKALNFYDAGDIQKSMFYLGACCHLIQDATVPHHVNNKLLKSHRKFELWIISRLMSDYSFEAHSGTIKYDTVDEYIMKNAVMANNTYYKNMGIADTEEKYATIAVTIMKEAQRTTAGLLLNYYNDINKNGLSF